MLDADANIEADLGIDSIKRMGSDGVQQHAGSAWRRSCDGRLTAIKTLPPGVGLAELLAGQAEAAIAWGDHEPSGREMRRPIRSPTCSWIFSHGAVCRAAG